MGKHKKPRVEGRNLDSEFQKGSTRYFDLTEDKRGRHVELIDLTTNIPLSTERNKKRKQTKSPPPRNTKRRKEEQIGRRRFDGRSETKRRTSLHSFEDKRSQGRPRSRSVGSGKDWIRRTKEIESSSDSEEEFRRRRVSYGLHLPPTLPKRIRREVIDKQLLIERHLKEEKRWKKDFTTTQQKDEDDDDDEEFESVTQDIQRFFLWARPSAESIEKREKFRRDFEKLVQRAVGRDAALFTFGSTATRLFGHNGDLDMCLLVRPARGNTPKWAITRISDEMRREGMHSQSCILGARVPILKLDSPNFAKRYPYAFDLSVNKPLSLFTSSLVGLYSQLDPRVPALIFILKHWAKEMNISDTFLGLTSFPLYMLVIFFCQTRPDPIVPNLQASANVRNPDDQWEVEGRRFFYRAPEDWQSTNTETLGELLLAFFEFGATFPFNRKVISVRCGRALWLAESLLRENPPALVNIEDPLEPDHNCSGRIKEQMYRYFRMQSRKGYCTLRKTHDLRSLLPLPKTLGEISLEEIHSGGTLEEFIPINEILSLLRREKS